MKTPIISEELLIFIATRYSVPARQTDKASDLRWKAAQRAVVDDLQALHEQQKGGAVQVNQYRIKSDD